MRDESGRGRRGMGARSLRACAMLAVALAGVGLKSAWGEEVTGTWLNPVGGNWTDAANWSTSPAVPNGADAAAVFGSVIQSNTIVTLDAPVTIGALTFDAAYNYTISGSGGNALTFESSSGPALLLLPETALSGGHRIAAPVVFRSEVEVDVGPASIDSINRMLTFGGTFTGDGDLTKVGPGALGIGPVPAGGTPNSAWAGSTHVKQGRLLILGSRNVGALGSTSSTVTVASGATLDVSGITAGGFDDQRVAAPNFAASDVFRKDLSIAGLGTGGRGALEFGFGRAVIAGNIRIAPEGAGIRTAGDRLHIGDPTGNVAGGSLGGAGRLTILGGAVQINLQPTYTAGTTIERGALVVGPRGSLIGTGEIDVRAGGQLRVYKPAGNDPANNPVAPNSVTLNGGMLALGDSALAPQGYISPASTSGTIGFTANYNQNLNLSTVFGGQDDGNRVSLGATVAVATYSGQISFNAGATNRIVRVAGGDRTLTLAGPLLESNHVQGLEIDAGTRTVVTTGQHTYTGPTIVRSGTLEVRGPLGASGPSDADGTIVHRGGTLALPVSNRDVTDRLVLAGGTVLATHSTPVNQFVGNIEVTSDSVLGSTALGVGNSQLGLRGDVSGTGRLSLNGAVPALLRGDLNLPRGLRVTPGATLAIAGGYVSAGRVEVMPDAVVQLSRGVGNDPAVHDVAPGTVALLGGSLTLFADIDPSRALASDSTGGFIVFARDNAHDINLSQVPGGHSIVLGASPSGTPSNYSGTISFNAPSTLNLGHGGSLKLTKPLLAANNVQGLRIHGGTTTLTAAGDFTGAVTIDGGTMTFEGDGSVRNSSGFIVNRGGTLLLSNGRDEAVAGRQVDAPVMLRGGALRLAQGNAVHQSVPSVKLESGASFIGAEMDRFSTGLRAALRIDSLERAKGATVNFESGDRPLSGVVNGVVFTSPIRNDVVVDENGVSFATVGQDWASYGTSGVVPLPSYHGDVNTATAAHNVKLTQSVTLSGPKTVHTLNDSSNGGTLDLGAHALTVRAGGILKNANTPNDNSTIAATAGGSLTAGTPEGGGELVFVINGLDGQTLNVSAPITDNGPGEVVLVKSGKGKLVLQGTNGYTGTTYVNEGVLSVATATPFGGVSGGSVVVNAGGTLRAAGTLPRAISGAGTIEPEVYGPGPLSLEIGAPSSASGFDFDGALNVATASVRLLDADEAVLGVSTMVGDGKLSSTNGIVLRNGRTLTGSSGESGTVEGAFRNEGRVSGPTTQGRQLTFSGHVSGTGTYAGNVRFTGRLTPQALRLEGATVVFDPAAGEPLATGSLSVDENSQLDLVDNEVIIEGATQQQLERVIDAVRAARNSAEGRWKGKGITSSLASATPLMTLAVGMRGDDAVAKYTYDGDADLDGRVNADDYFRIDSGFLEQPDDPQFALGDFNYDGRISADDYFLIDSAFLGQGAPIGIAGAASAAAAVPEPSGVSVVLLVGLLAGRRSRKS